MTEKIRFQTTRETIGRLEEFEKEGVLITCRCGKCAILSQIKELGTVPGTRIAQSTCAYCGKISQLPYSYHSLPLWLVTNCCGHSLWALNELV